MVLIEICTGAVVEVQRDLKESVGEQHVCLNGYLILLERGYLRLLAFSRRTRTDPTRIGDSR